MPPAGGHRSVRAGQGAPLTPRHLHTSARVQVFVRTLVECLCVRFCNAGERDPRARVQRAQHNRCAVREAELHVHGAGLFLPQARPPRLAHCARLVGPSHHLKERLRRVVRRAERSSHRRRRRRRRRKSRRTLTSSSQQARSVACAVKSSGSILVSSRYRFTRSTRTEILLRLSDSAAAALPDENLLGDAAEDAAPEAGVDDWAAAGGGALLTPQPCTTCRPLRR